MLQRAFNEITIKKTIAGYCSMGTEPRNTESAHKNTHIHNIKTIMPSKKQELTDLTGNEGGGP